MTKARPLSNAPPRGVGQRGSYLVELAIVFSVFLVLLFAALEYGRLAWIDAALSYTGNQAARYLASSYLNIGNPATAISNAQAIVRSMPGLANATIVVTPAGDNSSFTLQTSQVYSSPAARLIKLSTSTRSITIQMVLIKQ